MKSKISQNKPDWMIRAEKSLRRMMRPVKPLRIQVFNWDEYENEIFINPKRKNKKGYKNENYKTKYKDTRYTR